MTPQYSLQGDIALQNSLRFELGPYMSRTLLFLDHFGTSQPKASHD